MPVTNDGITGDAMVGFNFQLDIAGQITGYFTEVSGLGGEIDVVDHNIMAEGAVSDITRKIPGRRKWGDITLKRALTANMDVWEWRQMVVDGNVAEARRDGSIIMLSQEHEEVARWNFVAGWPSKVNGPSIKSDDSSVAMEEITIVHEGIERVT